MRIREWLDQDPVCQDTEEEDDQDKFFNAFKMTESKVGRLLARVQERITT